MVAHEACAAVSYVSYVSTILFLLFLLFMSGKVPSRAILHAIQNTNRHTEPHCKCAI